MVNKKIASRYARSLLMLCKEQGKLENVFEDMQLIENTCRESRDLTAMLNSPIINHDKKKIILKQVFYHKVNDLTLRIINLVTTKKRERFLPAIASEFRNMYNEFKKIQEAKIVTTVPLDEKMSNEIRTLVQRHSGKEAVELTEKVDEELIGGFVLDVGDRRIDTSIRNQIKSLRLLFAQ